MSSKSLPRIGWLAVAVLILLGAWWLRVHQLNTPDYWSDEAYSLYHLQSGSLGEMLTSIIRNEETPPLYFLLLAGWSVVGREELVTRALSAMFGVLAVAGALRIGRAVGGREAGWLSGGLLAVSYVAVMISRQARAYSLALVWVEAVIWITLQLVAHARWRDVWLWLLVSALGLYTHYLTALAVAASWLGILWLARKRDIAPQQLMTMSIGVGLLGLSLLPLLRAQLAWSTPTLGYVPPPSPALAVVVLDAFTLGGSLRQWPLSIALVSVLVIAAFTLWGAFRLARFGGPSRALLPFLVVPLLGSYLLSLRQPIFLPHYMFMGLPALCVVLATIIASSPVRWRRVTWVGSGMVLLVSACLPYGFPHRTPWSALAAHVAARAYAGEGIIFAPLYNRVPFELKYDGPPLHAVGILDYADYQPRAGQPLFAVTAADVDEAFAEQNSFWLVEDAKWAVSEIPGWRAQEQYTFSESTLIRFRRARP